MFDISLILKRSCFFILAFVMPLFIFGQQDENEDETDLINFSSLSPVQSEITKATGWAMQDNGRWLSSKNRIPFPDDKTNKSKAAERKLGQDNFISLQLRKVMIENKQYNVLIKIYHDGKYEFPILKEGWIAYKSLDFYVFEGKKLKEILPHEIPFNKKYAVNLNTYVRGTITDYENKVADDLIVKAIQGIERSETINDWNLVIAVYPIKNGEEEVCRFKLIPTFRKKYLASFYAAPDNWEKNFDMTFYEVQFYQFKSFIRESEEFLIPIDMDPNTIDDEYVNNYNWGVLKYQMGDYPTAIEYFDIALKANPETTDFLIFSFRGNAKSKMHYFGDAIEDFDKALDLRPEDIMDYSNWVKNYFNRGVAKYYLDDLNGACRDWSKALELGFGPAHDYLMEYCE